MILIPNRKDKFLTYTMKRWCVKFDISVGKICIKQILNVPTKFRTALLGENLSIYRLPTGTNPYRGRTNSYKRMNIFIFKCHHLLAGEKGHVWRR